MTSSTFQSDENNNNNQPHEYDIEEGIDVYNNTTNPDEHIDIDINNYNTPILNNVTHIFNNMINPINIITYYDNNYHYSIQNQNMILPVFAPSTPAQINNNDNITIVTPIEDNNFVEP